MGSRTLAEHRHVARPKLLRDMVLPDCNGDALAREIRSFYPSLPLVIASGRGQEDLRLLFKGVPQISLVSKPYTAKGLIAALRAIGIRCNFPQSNT